MIYEDFTQTNKHQKLGKQVKYKQVHTIFSKGIFGSENMFLSIF